MAPGNDDTVDARVPGRADAPELHARWVVADRYEILGLLGSGGMGTVYRARDRELDEVVALKMLKKQIAATAGILDRFRREVKLARRVTHANVARTFDIGEHAGAKFLTMEFIDGEMLGAMLIRRGRLRIGEVTRIGRDLCAGLSAAHLAGVIHRDLKPANVIIARDGRAVITDFGIARALTQGEATQTAAGMVVGTPAYMAPEQLEGAKDLDERTDIYALGTMLFELLAGEVPWGRETPMRGAMLRLQGPPPDLRVLRPTIADAAAVLIAKCMARLRQDRFTTVAEVAAALTALDGAAESSASLLPMSMSRAARTFSRTKLAVVPIVNEGATAEDYLAHGLTEDLVDVLDGVPELEVRPARYGAQQPTDADAVVTGTLRNVGDRVHVTLRLVTIEDGFPLWDGTFERPGAEIVAIADAAAAAIAEALTTKALAPARPMPTNPVAYDLYLRGRHAFLRGWYDTGGNALRLLGEAHMLAPGDATIAATYARALARSYGTTSSGEDVARRAKEIVDKALAIDPRRADARLALASVHLYRGECIGAATEVQRAYNVAPNDPDVHEMLGRLRAEVGPLDIAIRELELALAREPSFAEARFTLARVWALLGDRDKSETTLGPVGNDAAERMSHLLTALRFALWWKDRARLAELAPIVAALDPTVHATQLASGMIGVGMRGALNDEDRARLGGAFPSGASTGQRRAAFNAQLRAEIHLVCGELDAGIEAIRDADANGFVDLCWLDRCPLLTQVRGDRNIEAVRRSTTLRAARVSSILDGG
jgi:TolB-like protein/predicted Ser/Thr protein kinase